MLKLNRPSILLFAATLGFSVFVVLYTPIAHSREDFIQSMDDKHILPKVVVTGRRGGGFSSGFWSINVSSGSVWGFNPFRYGQNQTYLEQQCIDEEIQRACILLCEHFPSSDICPLIFGTITVTGNREKPYEPFNQYKIKFGKIVYTSDTLKDSLEEEKKKNELEKRCNRDLNQLFAPKEDFPFAEAFGITDDENNEEKVDKYIDQLFDFTKPIMTTGIDGYNNGEPVAYLIGLEAHNSFYIDRNGKLTRGNNLVFGTIPGLVTPNFQNDKQFREMLDSPLRDKAQRLVIDFHTHPNTNNYYVFPSSADIAKFIIDKRNNLVDENALIAIGFMSKNVFHTLFISINDNPLLFKNALKHSSTKQPKTFKKHIEYKKQYGEFLELLFENSKMLILDSTNNAVDNYLQFFEDNSINQIVGETIIIPQSCIELLKESK